MALVGLVLLLLLCAARASGQNLLPLIDVALPNGGFLKLGCPPNLTLNQLDFTISAHVYFESFETVPVIFASWADQQWQIRVIVREDGQLEYWARRNMKVSGQYLDAEHLMSVAAGYPLQVGTWYHIVATMSWGADRKTPAVTMYLDGVSILDLKPYLDVNRSNAADPMYSLQAALPPPAAPGCYYVGLQEDDPLGHGLIVGKIQLRVYPSLYSPDQVAALAKQYYCPTPCGFNSECTYYDTCTCIAPWTGSKCDVLSATPIVDKPLQTLSGQSVTLGCPPTLDVAATNFTVSANVNLTNLTQSPVIFASWHDDTYQILFRFRTNGQIEIALRDPEQEDAVSFDKYFIKLNTWTHLALTLKWGKVPLARLYVNGEVNQEIALTTVYTTLQKTPGCFYTGFKEDSNVFSDTGSLYGQLSLQVWPVAFNSSLIALLAKQYVCATPCVGNSECNFNTCTCKAGWARTAQPGCLTPLCDLRDQCSRHGTCVAPQQCSCTPPWTGVNCSDYSVQPVINRPVQTLSGQKVLLGCPPQVDLTLSDFTVSAHVNLTDFSQSPFIFGSWQDPNFQILFKFLEDCSVYLTLRGTGQSELALFYTHKIQANTWTHIAATMKWDASQSLVQVRFYVNGELAEWVDTYTNSQSLETNPGCYYTGYKEDAEAVTATGALFGKLTLQVWNVAFDSSDIALLAKQYVCETACVGNTQCSGYNTCTCLPGWSGSLQAGCLVPLCGDVRYCSGHGRCVTPQSCACDGMWVGSDCSKDSSPPLPPSPFPALSPAPSLPPSQVPSPPRASSSGWATSSDSGDGDGSPSTTSSTNTTSSSSSSSSSDSSSGSSSNITSSTSSTSSGAAGLLGAGDDASGSAVLVVAVGAGVGGFVLLVVVVVVIVLAVLFARRKSRRSTPILAPPAYPSAGDIGMVPLHNGESGNIYGASSDISSASGNTSNSSIYGGSQLAVPSNYADGASLGGPAFPADDYPAKNMQQNVYSGAPPPLVQASGEYGAGPQPYGAAPPQYAPELYGNVPAPQADASGMYGQVPAPAYR